MERQVSGGVVSGGGGGGDGGSGVRVGWMERLGM